VSEEPRVRCATCAWFKPRVEKVAVWPHLRPSDGECRAKPAQLILVGHSTYEYATEWPKVLRGDFCGSWRKEDD
jgi:hypothetical protein